MTRIYRIWLIALAVKTALAIWLPFSNDEAYYWVWGHHPQWSYFDHPPMVGWLFWLGTFLESFGNAARLPGVWMGHLTLLFWNEILKPYLDDAKRAWWMIFVLFSPFFGIGSLVITPDVPLLFFWSLSLLLFLKFIKRPSAFLAGAFGAALGLGFCSKYMIVLFVPTALAWLAWSGEWRKLRWKFVPLTILGGLLFCAPVVYWNSTHDWVSFRFQLGHGLSSEKWQTDWPFEYIGGQLLILFPVVVWMALRRREPKGAQFLHFFGWLPLGFFLYTSFKAHVEANWPIMAHPAILSLAFLNAPNSKVLRATLGIWVVAFVLALTEVAHHWLPVDPSKLKTAEFTRFDDLLPFVRENNDVYLGSYQMAAAVSYKLRRQVYKLGGMNRRDFYDFVPQSFPKNDSFFLIGEITHPIPLWLIEKGYKESLIKVVGQEFRALEVKRSAQDTHR